MCGYSNLLGTLYVGAIRCSVGSSLIGCIVREITAVFTSLLKGMRNVALTVLSVERAQIFPPDFAEGLRLLLYNADLDSRVVSPVLHLSITAEALRAYNHSIIGPLISQADFSEGSLAHWCTSVWVTDGEHFGAMVQYGYVEQHIE